MFKLFSMVLILCCLISLEIYAQQLDGKIAVLQLVNKAKIDADDVAYLTTQIQEKVQAKTKGKYQVMTQENILTLLPPDKTLEDCAASECEVDTGRILGAALIITGQIVKFGTQKELRCTIKLHETKTGTLLSSQTIKAKNIDLIESLLTENIDKLLTSGLETNEKPVEKVNVENVERSKDGMNLDGELLALEKHYQEVKKDWDKIKAMAGDKSKTLIVGKAVELFLKKYEVDSKGNPFEGEARKLLGEVQTKKVPILEVESYETINWILIKGGSLIVNIDLEEDEKAIHSMVVRDFYMSKSEVTVGQYKKCVDAGICSLSHWDDDSCFLWTDGAWNQGILGKEFRKDNQPVVCIDWKQAREFAKWVGGDLPSEAQWEYASRSGEKDIKYPWGNQEASCQYIVMSDGVDGCSRSRTWEVCSKTSGNTKQGLCDMYGNVWEWILDEYHNSYANAPNDDTGWCSDRECNSNTSANRVIRGGGWRNNILDFQSVIRRSNSPNSRNVNLGFRVVKSIH